ncbi:hypothetical protein GobsT_16500 [Gemmata obscuriglobus]|uniref:Carboxypeptidase regulatory-like domain-containing protein n=1 Tax=Gemmata obscuriglobus TaxID=114 RepID=A0A2Z3HE17_9BACT|nr:hypothetical protein [Gemmata obscuriglobus]AWM39954.1 hypothetical protein C1280_25075 [Gemmata obscuriglobus]QEG26902.1 hypothetical protein GobsT_16500 [Gemmata obscuriglobus]VTS02997.1 Uncharacterized protein OS=Singulisphaera acidiphila (strain ATCC BAA-1392 / DSM 18658 / VKM B-2454 / MOB10) GN=Sinac_3752 PE=4 SV=1 [Gemmata obscuriglobus UQM 2246]
MRIWLTMAAVCAALAAAGCGSKRPGEVPVYPVKGRVTFRGEPMPHAVVTFYPLGQPFAQALKCRANADPDGNYRLTTYELNDGAPEGEYGVILYVPPAPPEPHALEVPNPPDRLKGAYLDPAKSKLRYTVRPEPNTINIDLP